MKTTHLPGDADALIPLLKAILKKLKRVLEEQERLRGEVKELKKTKQ